MSTPDWRSRQSVTARDAEWHPVEITVGTVNTDKGPRFAVQVGKWLAIFTPEAGELFAAHTSAAVAETSEGMS